MCGIMGCIAQDNILPNLLAGLEKESYRGYDSSGIALNNTNPQVFKAVGELSELEKKVADQNLSASCGIGHNRWATHGQVTEENAHPHSDCTKKIWLVHNGIIENYKELKNKLSEQGHTFSSNTDSEVLAHLIEKFYDGDLEAATKQALQLVTGTYGLVVFHADHPDNLVAARMSSPLALVTTNTGSYVASDPAALLPYSKEIIFLEDGEVANINLSEYKVSDLTNKAKFKTSTTMDWSQEKAELGNFDHFMLKEIHEQPQAIINTLRGHLASGGKDIKLGGLDVIADKLAQVNRLQIIGCGTAYYAGQVGTYLMEEIAGLPAEAEVASEYRYRTPLADPNSATLVVSQSGETADTLAALQEVKQRGETTLGIVNVVGSSIAREIDAGLYNHIGPEIGVASTKAFTSQLTLLTLIAVYLGKQRNLTNEHAQEIVTELQLLPQKINSLLPKQAQEVKNVVETIAQAKSVLFVGRKYNAPVASEGALKLKEVSYVHAEGYPAGELKHGAIALIDKQTPTVAIVPQDSVYEKTLSNLEEIKSRSGQIIAIATEGDQKILEIANHVICIPKTIEALSPITAAVPLQLLAYYAGLALERNVDKPRNLAKSVTVE